MGDVRLDIGWRLVSAMDDAGVSVNEMCRRTGLSRRTVVAMRSDGAHGNMRSWMLVSEALGMTLVGLLTYGQRS